MIKVATTDEVIQGKKPKGTPQFFAPSRISKDQMVMGLGEIFNAFDIQEPIRGDVLRETQDQLPKEGDRSKMSDQVYSILQRHLPHLPQDKIKQFLDTLI